MAIIIEAPMRARSPPNAVRLHAKCRAKANAIQRFDKQNERTNGTKNNKNSCRFSIHLTQLTLASFEKLQRRWSSQAAMQFEGENVIQMGIHASDGQCIWQIFFLRDGIFSVFLVNKLTGCRFPFRIAETIPIRFTIPATDLRTLIEQHQIDSFSSVNFPRNFSRGKF